MTLDGSRLTGADLPLSSAPTPGRAHRADPEERLARLHAYFLEGSPSEVRSALEGVLVDALTVQRDERTIPFAFERVLDDPVCLSTIP